MRFAFIIMLFKVPAFALCVLNHAFLMISAILNLPGIFILGQRRLPSRQRTCLTSQRSSHLVVIFTIV